MSKLQKNIFSEKAWIADIFIHFDSYTWAIVKKTKVLENAVCIRLATIIVVVHVSIYIQAKTSWTQFNVCPIFPSKKDSSPTKGRIICDWIYSIETLNKKLKVNCLFQLFLFSAKTLSLSQLSEVNCTWPGPKFPHSQNKENF